MKSKIGKVASDFALVALFGVGAYFATKKVLEVANESAWGLKSSGGSSAGSSSTLVGFAGVVGSGPVPMLSIPMRSAAHRRPR